MHAPVTIPDTRFANLYDPRLSRAAGSVRRDWSWSLEQSNRRAPHALRIETAQSAHSPRTSSRDRTGAHDPSADDIRSRALLNRWRSPAHHLTVKRQVCDDLIEPCILVLEQLQPPHLVGQQPTIFFFQLKYVP